MFDYYFLAMMIIYCYFVYFHKSKKYREEKDYKAYKLSKKVSGTVFVISLLLFIAARFV